MAWTDGQSTWLVDGFFSRQPLSEVAFTRLKVDETQVGAVAAEMFKRLDMPSALSGIVVAHSHYDHSLDAPFLAKQYGARVVGSESTLQIAKGQDVPTTQIDAFTGSGRVKLGEFDIQLIQSAHAPTGFSRVDLTPNLCFFRPMPCSSKKESAFHLWCLTPAWGLGHSRLFSLAQVMLKAKQRHCGGACVFGNGWFG